MDQRAAHRECQAGLGDCSLWRLRTDHVQEGRVLPEDVCQPVLEAIGEADVQLLHASFHGDSPEELFDAQKPLHRAVPDLLGVDSCASIHVDSLRACLLSAGAPYQEAGG